YPGRSVEEFERLSEDERQAIVDEYLAIRELPGVAGGGEVGAGVGRGRGAGGGAPAPVESATTVRVQNGETLLTDGPFIDAKEHLGGYLVIELDDLDAVLEIAARI